MLKSEKLTFLKRRIANKFRKMCACKSIWFTVCKFQWFKKIFGWSYSFVQNIIFISQFCINSFVLSSFLSISMIYLYHFFLLNNFLHLVITPALKDQHQWSWQTKTSLEIEAVFRNLKGKWYIFTPYWYLCTLLTIVLSCYFLFLFLTLTVLYLFWDALII